ncbi:MAG: hypothetical protein Q7K44_01025 [Candidatus Liptonbacteria bacterium]|nr:hypothetical protein [Candidatus Liptonbacteria bacterium]
MSSIPTKFKFKDYEKAIAKVASEKLLTIEKENKSGSARRYEVFESDQNGKPKLKGFWVVHEDKQIYTRDMRKCLPVLGITEEKLISILEKI